MDYRSIDDRYAVSGQITADLVGQNLAASVEADADHGSRGLVAGGLDA